MDDKYPLDGLTFDAVELEIYSDPPDLPNNVSEDDKRSAWAEWLKANARLRGVHKRLFNKKNESVSLPDYEYNHALIKINGVYKQAVGPIGFEGNEGDVSLILTTSATQDRHYKTRGSRGQRGNKHLSARANKREQKRKKILSQRK